MVTKSAILGGIAATLAAGSAFSSYGTQNIWVKVKMTSALDSPTTCINTGQTCSDNGPLLCTVRLSVKTGPNTAETGSQFGAFKAGCIIPLFDSAHPKISEIAVYRLVSDLEETNLFDIEALKGD